MHTLNPYLDKKPDFAELASRQPSLGPYVTVSAAGYGSIDFQDADALRALTTALLKEDWGLTVELREDRLCPTLANRLDYLYNILDLEPFLPSQAGPSKASSQGPRRKLKVLDIGTGHIAIYPLLLHKLRLDAEIIATGSSTLHICGPPSSGDITDDVELDAVSFHHAVKTRQANNIAPSSISLLRPSLDQPILFPIFDSLEAGSTAQSSDPPTDSGSRAEKLQQGRPLSEAHLWDIVICNPPFFGSESEMTDGTAAKVDGAHAAPTAADNELITPGGEVRFVGQMITESVQLGEACAWYTSLIGKYSSLHALVDQLRQYQIDNYFIKIARQSRTTRWILGWSLGAVRLPDSLTRPEKIIPGTSFARLLPAPNTLHHIPDPPMTAAAVREAVSSVLQEIALLDPNLDGPLDTTGDASSITADSASSAESIQLAPRANTWSRDARRQMARSITLEMLVEQTQAKRTASGPLFRAELQFVMSNSSGPAAPSESQLPSSLTTPLARSDEGDGPPTQEPPAADGDQPSGGQLVFHFLEGRSGDRATAESLWKFLLTKAGLLRRQTK